MKIEKYLREAVANKQIVATLDTDKRELKFQLRKLFPPALIKAMGKSLKANQFSIDEEELKIYL